MRLFLNTPAAETTKRGLPCPHSRPWQGCRESTQRQRLASAFLAVCRSHHRRTPGSSGSPASLLLHLIKKKEPTLVRSALSSLRSVLLASGAEHGSQKKNPRVDPLRDFNIRLLPQLVNKQPATILWEV